MTDAPHAPAAALADRVRQLAAGGPYEVHPAEDGFEVALTAVDARWTTLMYRNGLRKAVAHRVRVDEAGRRFSVTDRTVDVEWQAGTGVTGVPTPRFRYAREVTSGRSTGTSWGKEFGLRDDGGVGVAAEWHYRVGEGRDLVRRAATELGWQEQMPRDQRIGLAVAAGTVVLGLVVGLVVLLVAVLG